MNNATHSIWAVNPKALQNVKAAKPAKKAEGKPAESGASEIKIVDGTAIVPVCGILLKYKDEFCDWIGGTSTLELDNTIRQLATNADVTKIALLIDSPGGQVAGVSDLAKTIAATNKIKPVIGIVSDSCCSGAYWLASQCSEIIANETALVGSIGVYEVLVDTSKLFTDAGIIFKVVKAGKWKAIGQDGVPITDDELAVEQVAINDLYELFVNAVATGREMKPADAKNLATGEVWIASKAIANGLIDRLGNLEGVLMPEYAAPSNAQAANANAPVASSEPAKTEATPAPEPKAEDTPAESKPLDAVNASVTAIKSAVETCQPAIDACGTIDEPDTATTDAIQAAVTVCDGAIKSITDFKAALTAVIDDADEDAKEPAATAPASKLEASAVTDRFAAILKACGNRHELAAKQFMAGHDETKAREAYVAALESEAVNGGGEAPIATRKGSGASSATPTAQFEADWDNNVDGCQSKHARKEFYVAYRKHFAEQEQKKNKR